ncbi:hypothetical protein RHSIM_Rhsim07G0182200 [Rhododendron simsii]|uniref:No apical meristem-associated C-terminal domain-containing protein n=1 Tax=Rhododendron simsii TaxID=118357 RepID=A0A834LJI4_RHOSS|nr:hypothetical protein RHSIM_Rhsim07G0182200 [Rhododendron simsii]
MPVDKSVSYLNRVKIIETTNEPSFTSSEDVAICKAFLSVLEDLRRNGNLQSQTNLCNGIFQKFVASTKNESRSQESVRSRWEKIMTRCFKFHAYLTRIRFECQKGLAESQMAYQAKLLYVECERQQFVMNHCWEILQHRLFKWQDIPDIKNPNMPAKTINSSPQSVGGSHILDVPFPSQEFNQKTCRGCSHSPNGETSGGREAEKERPQGKAKAVELETSHNDDLTEQLNKQAKEEEMKKAHLEERRLRLTKKMQEIEEKQVAAKQLEIDDAVMSMNTSKMDHQTQLYWAMRKDEIIARAFNRMDISG